MENLKKAPVFLVILDGFGFNSLQDGNAIAAAKMPTWNSWLKKYPNTLLNASGGAVGLPEGFMGNSEVGHLTIGSGRVVKSVLAKVDDAIKDGSFVKNEKILNLFKKLKDENKSLHLMGLLSDAGVHSHIDHLFAFLEMAKNVGLKNVYVHPFLDGRDTSPKSATKYLNQLESFLQKIGIGKIASLHGRFYAMDRDRNWDRVEKSCNILTQPEIVSTEMNWQEALKKSYENGDSDEFVKPILLDEKGRVQSGDGVVFFNFRPDRARELTECLTNPNFKLFKVNKDLKLSFFVCMSCYASNLNAFVLFDEDEVKIQNTFLNVLVKNNKKIFAIAETEKYAHVTYFFNGMNEENLPNEIRILIPSVKTKNYIQCPQMSANEITQKIVESLNDDVCDFYLVNYANADMVGHSADFEATIKACEVLDQQLTILYKEVVLNKNGILFVTADHGNAECVLDEQGNPKSCHTTNPVPFMAVSKEPLNIKIAAPIKLGISSIAPTILKFMKLDIPKEMTDKTIF
ncbi:TPA: 2,3-bisphosphoglycerate-independent phosphoglycerate mutase [Candidatus Dependentiae bacterium]|nr:MAG: 2,3-bisphosphoglycerate-independent phosphoglycerate mutase [candidate division TM6 bacterium GW2011_GWE2_31_21]KKP53995.1 MAG: 2,3-bisphosphoglycerate-independent phosphoglycerate mutase [candidate division TM6 bacterium GW2011_GWF2_33_332]HBS48424.1 2,3-bisphosphoglycerate-independent phosphoglycerate mutase [Candidatus Dependentiae bacterium]HBZ72902.1 2,3-bisphosphoglycerate-independent phosphoglycerate mutase [Candidatus Dependentiae bacterium]